MLFSLLIDIKVLHSCLEKCQTASSFSKCQQTSRRHIFPWHRQYLHLGVPTHHRSVARNYITLGSYINPVRADSCQGWVFAAGLEVAHSSFQILWDQVLRSMNDEKAVITKQIIRETFLADVTLERIQRKSVSKYTYHTTTSSCLGCSPLQPANCLFPRTRV